MTVIFTWDHAPAGRTMPEVVSVRFRVDTQEVLAAAWKAHHAPLSRAECDALQSRLREDISREGSWEKFRGEYVGECEVTGQAGG